MSKADFHRVMKNLDTLSEKAIPAAQARAINNLNRPIQKRALQNVQRLTGLQQKAIRRRIKWRRVKGAGRVGGTFTVFTQPVPAIGMGVRKVRQGIRQGRWERGFVNRGFGGKEQLFQRTGDSRYPINAVKIEVKDALQRALRRATPLIIRQRYRTEFVKAAQFEVRKRLRTRSR